MYIVQYIYPLCKRFNSNSRSNDDAKSYSCARDDDKRFLIKLNITFFGGCCVWLWVCVCTVCRLCQRHSSIDGATTFYCLHILCCQKFQIIIGNDPNTIAKQRQTRKQYANERLRRRVIEYWKWNRLTPTTVACARAQRHNTHISIFNFQRTELPMPVPPSLEFHF